ncbi:MAG: hypothetical protein HY930_05500 [Euryarchaeota archaeon]|nr:hypothetical protein [Euryarchaeota archaeon]
MAAYPYLVQIAWDVIEKFLKDWQCEPYRWSREIDIQTEISSRISSIYRNIGYDTVKGNYKGAVLGFEHNQIWNRVCCEPNISYVYKDRKKYFCYPDIVIWDDIENPDAPPDATGESNWPMLWVCEIKFEGEMEEDWDIEKMKYLLIQNDAKYACWLNLFRKRAETGNGITWEKSIGNERLWLCSAMLPALK